MQSDQPDGVATDLIAYLIVAVPNLESLATVTPALAELVQHAAIRILDLVVLVKDEDGLLSALEADSVEEMATLLDTTGEMRHLLSDDDIGLVSLALSPGTVGVVLVTEDRWGEPLSRAARLAGGRIIAGERIPSSRVESALANRVDGEERGLE